MNTIEITDDPNSSIAEYDRRIRAARVILASVGVLESADQEVREDGYFDCPKELESLAVASLKDAGIAAAII